MKKYISIFLLFLIVIHWTTSKAQDQNRNITLGNQIQNTIDIGSQHEYEVLIDEGQFALFNVEQKGIDVKIMTRDPDGSEIEEFDSPNGPFGNELVVIDANQSGIYTLELIPLGENKKEKTGSYTIELVALNTSIISHLNQSFELIGEANYLPGFFVSITNEEEILYSNGQGFANLKEKIPYTVKTIQQIESISKTFIGIAVMQLVEEGKLNLDADINTYLPFKLSNPYFPNSIITLRQLATHTASIDDRKQQEKSSWIENEEVFYKNKAKYIHKKRRKFYESILMNEEISMEKFLKSFFVAKGDNYSKKNFLKNKPGERWYYSNVGATLAAYIVQLVSKQPYNEYVVERIITPLKLEQTTWGFNPSSSEVSALKYGGGRNEYPRIMCPTYPEGAIYTNTLDLTAYLRQWMKSFSGTCDLLDCTSYQEIMTIQFEESEGQFKGVKNGLFWWMFGESRMGHNGGDMGTNANMFFRPDLNIGYISLENMQYGESEGAMIQSRQIKKYLIRYLKYFSTN